MSAKRNKGKTLSKSVAGANTSKSHGISGKVAEVQKGSTDHCVPTFAFDFTDEQKFCLWDADELYHRSLMKTLKKMRSITWSDIKCHSGLRMKRITTRYELPPDVSPDIDLLEVRISDAGRLHGFRVDELFQVIWFDPTHDVCPENKVRR